eukprot:CAMPEP_0175825592 /NCGR_PEP_ID=MMETSP0107_2-20121207/11333_1 /TAXON_ID=195067 ORGANISM="Goniomonas pacifica, Strain CCMP1869" /NCGR_SAMPLE_ID=MMETSP0107_2 /ASSEMBLY_ACC=CAM_ASM_000203 /LENGTH=467 /DNA_ID=CAMNT_0017138213 /DNA_START=14 /DNA_END=1417 /DNA_ORIENTATION=+
MALAKQRRCALVVGGTSGVGLAAAKALVCADFNVMIVGRDAARGKDAVAELESDAKGPVIMYCQADFTKAEDRSRMLSQFLASFGKLSTVLCFAGTTGPQQLTPGHSDLEATFAINTFAPVHFFYEALPHFSVDHGKCTYIVGSSLWTLLPKPRVFSGAAYLASKAALDCFTRSMACAGVEANVRVFAVCPLYFDVGQAASILKLFHSSEDEVGPPASSQHWEQVLLPLVEGTSAWNTGDCIGVFAGLLDEEGPFALLTCDVRTVQSDELAWSESISRLRSALLDAKGCSLPYSIASRLLSPCETAATPPESPITVTVPGKRLSLHLDIPVLDPSPEFLAQELKWNSSPLSAHSRSSVVSVASRCRTVGSPSSATRGPRIWTPGSAYVATPPPIGSSPHSARSRGSVSSAKGWGYSPIARAQPQAFPAPVSDPTEPARLPPRPKPVQSGSSSDSLDVDLLECLRDPM